MIIINKILNTTKENVDNLTFKKISKASLAIKETMTFDLYFNGKAVGGISLDIKKGREEKFNAIDKKLLRFLLHISKSFYSKDMEKEYKMQQAYFQQLFDKSTEAIALLDNNGRILKISKSFINLFGYSYKESKGINIDDLIVPDNKKEEGLKYLNKIINEKEIEVEAVRKNKFGGNIDVSLHAFPIKLDYGQIGIYAIYNDISNRKKEEARIKYLSFHDHLTGLYNRRFFNIEMQRLDNSRHLPISIIMADINDLKYINDKYGHTMGDRYIKAVANILKNITRSDDIVARVGGDEYAIILIENGLRKTKSFLDRINNNIKKLNIKNNLPEKFNIALGFSIKYKKEENLFKIFEKADKEMYKRKIKMKRRE